MDDNLSVSDKTWFKELLGLPTYISVALLALVHAGNDSFAYILYIILGLVLYNIAYKIVFLNGDVSRKWLNVASFLFAQVVAWAVVFYML